MKAFMSAFLTRSVPVQIAQKEEQLQKTQKRWEDAEARHTAENQRQDQIRALVNEIQEKEQFVKEAQSMHLSKSVTNLLYTRVETLQ